MVQFQKPKKIYNDRRLFFGGGPGIMSNFSFGSIASSSQNVDRRSNHSKGSFMPPGPPNGAHKPGLHTDGYPMPRVPIPPYHGGPQPYATPTRGAVHGPVGVVPHVPQPGSQDFGAGHGSDGAPIGSHLPHQQGPQQPIGNIGSNFNFPALESPSSQPSIGGPLSQPGYVSNESGQKLVGSTFGVARFAFSACHLHSSHFRAHLSISPDLISKNLKNESCRSTSPLLITS